MKYFVPFFACLILVSCTKHAATKHKKTDLEALHYNGRVKIITYKIYKAIDDSGKAIKGNLISKVVTRCDSAGYFVEQSNFKGGDKLSFQIVRRYDANGNITEEDKVQQTVQYLTPGNTKPDSLTILRDSICLKTDAHGNILEKKVLENGKPWYRDVNILDDKGNVIVSHEYVPWDTLSKMEAFKYDDQGNMVEKTWLRADSSLINKCTYTYNPAGDITTIITYNSNGSIANTETRKYDEKGDKTTDSCAKNDGTLIYNSRYQFTAFDDKGNWIKEVYYDNNKPQSITERVIEYYK